MAVGDTLTVADNNGREYECRLTKIRDEECECEIIESRVGKTEPPVKITLFMGYPKGDKLETVIQKAVELGAYEIVAVMSERCVARPDGKAFAKRLERLKKISESAAAQCGRSIIPEIRGIISYSEAIKEIQHKDVGFICYEGDGTVALPELLKEKPETIGFLIGPEGGIAEKEVNLAKQSGINLAGLGKRILRTETASGYVLSAISVLLEL
jgi:16S rRNA (uracil1498-N3)-methyltransferase